MVETKKTRPRDFLINAENSTSLANQLLEQLFPICRSLTGKGVRDSLKILQSISKFTIGGIASGTEVFDWVVPEEWGIKEAFIDTIDGERIIDFRDSNIHLVNFSAPVDSVLSYEKLKPHLHSLPKLPDAIPYRTSYYKKDWGFCLTHNQLLSLDTSKKYRAVIKSSHKPGVLNYGECLLRGNSGKEFLISTYCCHPSMANDNLSGMILWILLLKWLKAFGHRHSYRFVIAPETIGAIAYLWKNFEAMQAIDGGYILTTAGGPGDFSYSQSFSKENIIDRAAKLAFLEYNVPFETFAFDVTGSDERQYSSPAFRIPVGSITKSKFFEYDFYHTSLDNLDFVKSENLMDSLALYIRTIMNLERDSTYLTLNPRGEPMLGKRGLYPTIGGKQKQKAASESEQKGNQTLSNPKTARGDEIEAMFYCDGESSIMDIAEFTQMPVSQIYEKAELLRKANLLKLCD